MKDSEIISMYTMIILVKKLRATNNIKDSQLLASIARNWLCLGLPTLSMCYRSMRYEIFAVTIDLTGQMARLPRTLTAFVKHTEYRDISVLCARDLVFKLFMSCKAS